MSNYEGGTLGWWMDERRAELDGMTWDEVAREAGVSPETLRRNAKDAASMRTTTRRGIERALQWKPGSIQAIIDGGEPTEEPPTVSVPSSEQMTQEILDQIDELRRQVLKLRSGNAGRNRRSGT